MYSEKTQKVKREKGITLIALVITIVILIILASVAINMAFGDSGLIKITDEAKGKSEIATVEEKVQLTVASSFEENGRFSTNKLKENLKENFGLDDSSITEDENGNISITINGHKINISKNGEMIKEAIPGKIVTGGNAVYKDGQETAIIPEGFAVVTNPDTINKGLVISDVANDNMNNDAKGNQFVWVPVSKENFEKEFVREDFGTQNIPIKNFIDTSPIAGYYYEPNLTNNAGVDDITKTEIVKIYNSVKENGGFYIARYEAGNENDKIVTKKMYETLKVSFNENNANGGALEIARQMYPGHSHLCYGVEWDSIMRWINKDENLRKFLSDSNQIGFYGRTSEEYILTGSNSQYQIKNIYDMAGNVSEWTMEMWGQNVRIIRGGSSKVGGTDRPITNRTTGNPAWSAGIRVAFYI